MLSSVFYKGYVIEVHDKKSDYRFIVRKDGNLVLESIGGYAVPEVVEVQGKLYVNRLVESTKGWMVM